MASSCFAAPPLLSLEPLIGQMWVRCVVIIQSANLGGGGSGLINMVAKGRGVAVCGVGEG